MKNQFLVEDFIGIYPEYYSEKYCKDVINHYKFCNGLNKKVKEKAPINYLELCDTNCDPVVLHSSSVLGNSFATGVWEAYSDYSKKYGVIPKLATHRISSSVKIQKINSGGDTEQWSCYNRDSLSSRKILTAVLFLNNVDQGGEIEFLYQSKRVYSDQGTLVLFPSSYTHSFRDNTPYGVDRYTLVTWLEFID